MKLQRDLTPPPRSTKHSECCRRMHPRKGATSYIVVELQRSLGGAHVLGEESSVPAEKTQGLGRDLVTRQAFRRAVADRRYQVAVGGKRHDREINCFEVFNRCTRESSSRECCTLL